MDRDCWYLLANLLIGCTTAVGRAEHRGLLPLRARRLLVAAGTSMVATTFARDTSAGVGLVPARIVGNWICGVRWVMLTFSFSHDMAARGDSDRLHGRIRYGGNRGIPPRIQSCLSGAFMNAHLAGSAGDGEYHHRFAGPRSRKDACCADPVHALEYALEIQLDGDADLFFVLIPYTGLYNSWRPLGCW